jgi:peptidyl-prolyl cis-trans isomerase D
MAVIQKIQKQTGCLLLIIGIAMISFVLTDLISTRSSLFGGNDNTVAEIRGEKIDYTDLNNRYEAMVNNLKINNPDIELNEEMREAYREQSWNELIQEKIIKREHEKLGLSISGREFADITVGENTHPRVKQAFADQQTQVFDKNRFIKFIQEDIEADEELKYKWLTFFETPIKDEEIGKKYAALLRNALYVNVLDADVLLAENNNPIGASMVGVPYTTISDSAVKYDDSDLKAYLKKNKDKYKQDASADIDFVLFNVVPSVKDSVDVKKWAESSLEKFKKATNDSSFVEIMGSESFFDNTFKNRGSFPAEVDGILFNSDSGTVIGPIYNNGRWALYKVSAISYDSLFSMQASHIMVPVLGNTAADTIGAIGRANTLMAEIKSGAKSFEDEASKNFDATGAAKGDMGWIREGATNYPEKFVKELMRRNQGDMYVSADASGVHIVKVTGGKSKKTIKVAVLDRTIQAGNETDKEAYRLAGELASEANNNDDFEKICNKKGYSMRVADKITEKDKNVPGIKNATPIIRWIYSPETKKGTVSEVLEVDGKYLVAKCRTKRKEGVPSIDDVREALTAEVIRTKKAELITEKFEKALKSAKNMDALAKAMNTNVQDIPNQTFASTYIPFAGNDAKLLGYMFALPEKKMSKVIDGEQGVYVLMVNGQVAPPVVEKPEGRQRAMLEEYKSRAEGQILEALKAGANIKDYRYKYF